MPVLGAVIGGVASIGGALLGAHSASSAANAQVQAAQLAADTQRHMYDTTRADLMPWMTTGGSANSALAGIYGLGPGGTGVPNSSALQTALENFPGYQFAFNQGNQALDRSAAARGTLLSGGQLKDAQTYGQGFAMANAWQPYISQLNAMSGVGENAAAKTGEIGQSAAGNISSAQLSAGNAQANGALASGLGYAQALNGVGSMLGSYLGGGGGGGGSNWTSQFDYGSGINDPAVQSILAGA